MRRKGTRRTALSDERLLELFGQIKSEYEPDDEWLKEQRLRLQGALAVAEESGPFTRLLERLGIVWEDIPYLLSAARPAVTFVTAVVIGVVAGRLLFVPAAEPGAALARAGEPQAQYQDVAEMIRSGQVKGVDVGLTDDPENPVELNLTIGKEMKLTGSAEREDILAALEYVLVKDPNPGQRLQSARILGNTAQLGSRESTLMAMVSALLTDDNPGIRLSIIRDLRGIQNPLVRDALVKTVMEDENDGVRLAAVESLSLFLDDLAVRSALLLVSRMDPVENVRFQAYQILSEARTTLLDEKLDSP